MNEFSFVKLKDIGEIVTGNTPKTSDSENYSSNDVPFLKPSDFGNDNITMARTECFVSNHAKNQARILPVDSVAVTCIGVIGKVLVTDRECAFNQQINAIIPKSCFLSRYIAYAIMFQREILQNRANAAVVPIINKSDFSNVQIPICSFEKQCEIVTVLDKLSTVINLRQKQLKKLDELVKSRFIELFGAIKDEIPIEYYIGGLSAGKSLAGEEECENKVLKTGAVTFDYFDANQVKNLPIDYKPPFEHLVKSGDVLISRMNTAELVGAAAYVWNAPPKTYLPDRLWRAELMDTANPIFIWQILIQPSTKDQIKRVASGTSGSMKNISKPNLLAISVKKVPLDLQNQFAEFVKQTDKSKYLATLCIKLLGNERMMFCDQL